MAEGEPVTEEDMGPPPPPEAVRQVKSKFFCDLRF